MKQSTEEAKAKGDKFSELAKRNELHNHLGMTGYTAKMEKWRQEKGRQLRSGSRIHYRASMRGQVTTSMPACQKC